MVLLLFNTVIATVLPDFGYGRKSVDNHNLDTREIGVSAGNNPLDGGLITSSPETSLKGHQHATSALSRRGRPAPGLTYRFYKMYIVNPVSAEAEKMVEDFWSAFVSYQKAVSKLEEADHPPYSNLTLGYGRLTLSLTCSNPLHSDDVREILSFLLFMAIMRWAALFSAVFWALNGAVIAVIFTTWPGNPQQLLVG
ncbi:MAG: hypothetical protein Q9191_005747 [Dirinaria sp. TL-2023a]